MNWRLCKVAWSHWSLYGVTTSDCWHSKANGAERVCFQQVRETGHTVPNVMNLWRNSILFFYFIVMSETFEKFCNLRCTEDGTQRDKLADVSIGAERNGRHEQNMLQYIRFDQWLHFERPPTLPTTLHCNWTTVYRWWLARQVACRFSLYACLVLHCVVPIDTFGSTMWSPVIVPSPYLDHLQHLKTAVPTNVSPPSNRFHTDWHKMLFFRHLCPITWVPLPSPSVTTFNLPCPFATFCFTTFGHAVRATVFIFFSLLLYCLHCHYLFSPYAPGPCLVAIVSQAPPVGYRMEALLRNYTLCCVLYLTNEQSKIAPHCTHDILPFGQFWTEKCSVLYVKQRYFIPITFAASPYP